MSYTGAGSEAQVTTLASTQVQGALHTGSNVDSTVVGSISAVTHVGRAVERQLRQENFRFSYSLVGKSNLRPLDDFTFLEF